MGLMIFAVPLNRTRYQLALEKRSPGQMDHSARRYTYIVCSCESAKKQDFSYKSCWSVSLSIKYNLCEAKFEIVWHIQQSIPFIFIKRKVS